MSDFKGFKDSFLNLGEPSKGVSGSGSGSDSFSLPGGDTGEAKSINISNSMSKGGNDNAEKFLSRSLDIKKQLSQSFHGASGGGGSGGGNSSQQHGGISKPQSRKNSTFAVKSDHGSDNDEQDDDDQEDSQGNERKRRDNINDKIQELLTLIPPDLFRENTVASNTQITNNAQLDHDAAVAAAVKNSGTKDGKPNKGQILTKSVEYLQHLQNVIDENNREEVELIIKLKNLELQEQNKVGNVPINVGHTSAERALGKIGVGPLSDDYFKLVLVNSAGTNKAGQRRGSAFGGSSP